MLNTGPEPDVQTLSRWEESLHKKQAPRAVAKTGHISDLFDKQILEELESQFTGPLGPSSLTEVEFKTLMRAYLPSNLADNIYRSIDVNDVGCVSYSDFTYYLIASEEGSSFSSRTYASRLMLDTQQEEKSFGMHHRVSVCTYQCIYVYK
jgi:hypothetical protein